MEPSPAESAIVRGRTTETPIRVFVSSPGDLAPERRFIIKVCRHLSRSMGISIQPLLWEGGGSEDPNVEAFPPYVTGNGPQAAIDQRLWDDLGGYDIYVGMIWQRMGTPIEPWRSGTEAEYQIARQKRAQCGRPSTILFYRKIAAGDGTGHPQLGLVADFVAELASDGLLQQFGSTEELEKHLIPHLTDAVNRIRHASDHDQVAVPEVLEYLDTVAERAGALPAYYPAALRSGEPGRTSFDAIRQMVRVIEDRSTLEQRRAADRERQRASGLKPEDPATDDYERRPLVWDEHAGERFRHAVILGDPGSGKTWLLRYEARRLARLAAHELREHAVDLDALTLPIYARLPDLSRGDEPLEDTLAAVAAAERSQVFQMFLREKLLGQRCLVLLDGWDEVPVEVPPDGQPIRYAQGYRQRLAQRLENFARRFSETRILLTSRIVGYTGSPVPNAQELELLPLEPPQTEAFCRVWFNEEIEEEAELLNTVRANAQASGLARIPLMLALMCRAHQEKQLDSPMRRTELYRHCLYGLLRDWKEEKEERRISDAYVESVLEVLREVAYELLVDSRDSFSDSLLRRKIVPLLDGLKPSHELYARSASSVIDQWKRDGILIAAGDTRDAALMFLHRSFQEWLAASRMAEKAAAAAWPAMAPFVSEKVSNPAWEQVIVLLASQLADPVPLLNLILGEEQDSDEPSGREARVEFVEQQARNDPQHRRLALAAQCLSEIKAELRESISSIVDRVTTMAFSLWWWSSVYDELSTDDLDPLSRSLPALAVMNGRDLWADNRSVLETLCELLSHPHEDARYMAARALQLCGHNAARHPDVIPSLVTALRDRDWEVSSSAAAALGGIGQAAAQHPAVIPALTELVADRRAQAQEGSTWAQSCLFRPWQALIELGGVDALGTINTRSFSDVALETRIRGLRDEKS